MKQMTLLHKVVAIASIWSSAVGATQEITSAPSPWSHASIWQLENTTYTLSFCVQGDTTTALQNGMVFDLLPLASTAESDVIATIQHGTTLFHTFSSKEVTRESIKQGSELSVNADPSVLSSANVLYRVEFNAAEESMEITTDSCVDATAAISNTGFFMLLAVHSPSEVRIQVLDKDNTSALRLKCVSGCEAHDDIATVDLASHEPQWINPIVASLLISLTSLVGVVILSFDKGNAEAIVNYMTSFAAGCLLGVVVFHLYTEGSEYLEDVGDWMMGTCVLSGVAISMVVEQGVHMMLESFGAHPCESGHSHGHHSHHNHATLDSPHETDQLLSQSSSPNGHSHASHHHHHHDHHVSIDLTHSISVYDESKSIETPIHQKWPNLWMKYVTTLKFVEPVAWITAVGDFFHAFTDGVILAVAFKSCSSSLGWAVAFGIVLHEVPHRVGDFFIFLKAGMVITQALAVNFLASLASLIGVVILLAAGTVSDHALGVLLGIGAGALLFIAMTELLPPMLAVRERNSAFGHFLAFGLGCVLMGLSTLQDIHCDAN